MKAVISPGVARGVIQAPPSKSMAHRQLICAALSGGCSTVRGVEPSEDILATADCLRALGAGVDCDGDTASIRGFDPRRSPSAVLRCRESDATGRQ